MFRGGLEDLILDLLEGVEDAVGGVVDKAIAVILKSGRNEEPDALEVGKRGVMVVGLHAHADSVFLHQMNQLVDLVERRNGASALVLVLVEEIVVGHHGNMAASAMLLELLTEPFELALSEQAVGRIEEDEEVLIVGALHSEHIDGAAEEGKETGPASEEEVVVAGSIEDGISARIIVASDTGLDGIETGYMVGKIAIDDDEGGFGVGTLEGQHGLEGIAAFAIMDVGAEIDSVVGCRNGDYPFGMAGVPVHIFGEAGLDGLAGRMVESGIVELLGILATACDKNGPKTKQK